ncbi:hypothetical protein [Bittarella massiliensis (ex Durand et al. 2017)]|uniref:hypothetical protein n=1 Tax=Bittarella massiliensis (ex Durand et al. 2017) TaxID=1720313 RepID=UPI00073E82DB|nr:hypothetical protein [Bittarella massiliensis (ex Durand et al. 2017)]
MIVLERTAVMNWENAMRGARNPMNSWARGDSSYGEDGSYQLGENDLSLALRLCRSGSDHRKFIRQIFVSVDITAPLYWWKEFDTYKVGTVANSTSTMHKIHAKPFSREDFSCDRMDERTLSCLDGVIVLLEQLRQDYLADKDKTCWYSMIQLLPESYNQLRTVTLNYENLVGMYFARRTHKLDEWHVLCDWVKTLPYMVDILRVIEEG